MLLGGLWHGASWNFVFWGFLHGAALALHRAWRAMLPRLIVPRIIATPLTTLFAILCWVPFRAPSSEAARAMFAALFGLGAGRNVWLPAVLGWSLLLVIAGHVAGAALERGGMRRLLSAIDAEHRSDAITGTYLVLGVRSIAGAFVVAAAILSVYYFGALETSPFIYFRF
jgi:hypothetical protein